MQEAPYKAQAVAARWAAIAIACDVTLLQGLCY